MEKQLPSCIGQKLFDSKKRYIRAASSCVGAPQNSGMNPEAVSVSSRTFARKS